MPIKIDYSKCCWQDGACRSCSCGGVKTCVGCVEACPQGAITRQNKVEVDNSKCLNCGLCVSACSHDAIIME